MTQGQTIDGVLLQWGDRLFYRKRALTTHLP